MMLAPTAGHEAPQTEVTWKDGYGWSCFNRCFGHVVLPFILGHSVMFAFFCLADETPFKVWICLEPLQSLDGWNPGRQSPGITKNS